MSMRQRIGDFFGFVVFTIVALMAAIAVILSLFGCSSYEPTWPDSAEFSQLESGQDRFSMHDTNLSYFDIIVDHQTGVQYLYYSYKGHSAAMTPLLNVDGTPMLVSEAV